MEFNLPHNVAVIRYFCTMSLSLRKSLGQHFLHDEQVCKKIVQQLTLHPALQLLEVGPGGGAISKYLMKLPDVDYRAVEIDREKVDFLVKELGIPKDRILLMDVLKMDVPYPTRFSVIGNFPYNISTQIMFRILEWEPQVDEVIGMFQKEVAQRIAAGPGSKTYGILSVLLQAFFKVDYLFEVHENCFTPPPQVKSAVVRFTNLHDPHAIADRKKFTLLVKTAFNQRRKTLRNALKSILPPIMLQDPIMEKRAEQLSVEDFVNLYNTYKAIHQPK